MSLLRQAATTASTNWYLDSQNNEYCMKWMEISHLHELLVRSLSLWEHEGEDGEWWWHRQALSLSLWQSVQCITSLLQGHTIGRLMVVFLWEKYLVWEIMHQLLPRVLFPKQLHCVILRSLSYIALQSQELLGYTLDFKKKKKHSWMVE